MPLERKVRITLFVRILVPLALSIALVQATIVYAGWSGRQRVPRSILNERMRGDLHKYAALAREGRESLRQLLDAEDVGLVLDAVDGSWRSSPELPDWESLAERSMSRAEQGATQVIFGMFRKRIFYGERTADGKRALLAAPGKYRGVFGQAGFWTMLSLQVTGILVVFLLFLYWQLRPIRKLHRGVQAVARGDLHHRVAVEDSSELGALSHAFNAMVDRLRSLVEAKEELVLGVSHELRAPLSALALSIEMIEDPARREKIRAHLQRMEKLVNELLESHRISAGGRRNAVEPVDLGALVEKIVYSQPDTAPEVSWAVAGHDIIVRGDPAQLEKLVRNLVENAAKYAGDERGPILVTATGLADEVRLEVRDTGPGIPTDELGRVFEPFYRVEKSRSQETGGFGLGLFLCSKIAAAHDGTITVRNHSTGGCTFSVTFPRTA